MTGLITTGARIASIAGKKAALAVIWLYQHTLGLLTGPNCRYHPTCSNYTRMAIQTHGLVAGIWLGLKRIGRCHPWGGQGHDPVPPARSTCADAMKTDT